MFIELTSAEMDYFNNNSLLDNKEALKKAARILRMYCRDAAGNEKYEDIYEESKTALDECRYIKDFGGSYTSDRIVKGALEYCDERARALNK